MFMKSDKMDPKKKVLEELMAHLDQKDGEELGQAIKPKGVGLEVMKVEKLGDESELPEGLGEEPALEAAEGSDPKMSPEEIEELIEAIQSKLG